MLLHEGEQHRAVGPALLADAPGLRHAHSVILDRGIRLHARIDRHDDLVRRVAFKLLQAPVELIGNRRRHDAGGIVEIAGRSGRNDLRGVQADGASGEADEKNQGAGKAHQSKSSAGLRPATRPPVGDWRHAGPGSGQAWT